MSPEPTAAELAAIVAVLGERPAPTGIAPTDTAPWHDAARLAGIRRAWPRAAAGGWARVARREMQHAEHG